MDAFSLDYTSKLSSIALENAENLPLPYACGMIQHV